MSKISSNSNTNDTNDKEKFLEKQNINNFLENGDFNTEQQLTNNQDSSSTLSQKYKKEKLGLLVSAISVLFGSSGQIYTKIIQSHLV